MNGTKNQVQILHNAATLLTRVSAGLRSPAIEEEAAMVSDQLTEMWKAAANTKDAVAVIKRTIAEIQKQQAYARSSGMDVVARGIRRQEELLQEVLDEIDATATAPDEVQRPIGWVFKILIDKRSTESEPGLMQLHGVWGKPSSHIHFATEEPKNRWVYWKAPVYLTTTPQPAPTVESTAEQVIAWAETWAKEHFPQHRAIQYLLTDLRTTFLGEVRS